MKQITLEIFARRLKKLRTDRNLSTRALGEIVGTSNATISRYETGKRDPDLIIVHKIAAYFDVTIEYLCGEDADIGVETLIETYTQLNQESKADALKYLTYLYEKGRE